jgi:hypothetical protein
MKITITAITDWEEDAGQIAGDASHEGERAVERMLEEERAAKLDDEWTTGLPFACEAEDLEDALDQYNEKFCEYDYLKAADADCDED